MPEEIFSRLKTIHLVFAKVPVYLEPGLEKQCSIWRSFEQIGAAVAELSEPNEYRTIMLRPTGTGFRPCMSFPIICSGLNSGHILDHTDGQTPSRTPPHWFAAQPQNCYIETCTGLPTVFLPLIFLNLFMCFAFLEAFSKLEVSGAGTSKYPRCDPYL